MSDDDLIRRSDAVKVCRDHEEKAVRQGRGDFIAHGIDAEAIAALPARGVGVHADVKDYAIDVSEAYDTMMEVQRNPAGAWQVIQALAGHIAALEPAPTDAAQARVIRNGEHLFNTAKSLGWADDGEGALEFVMRRTREVALEDAAQARGAALLQRAAQLAYEVWDDPEALEKAILALGEART